MSPKLIAGIFIFSIRVLITQAGDNLTEKYESAKSQITQLSISAYSNALSNLMAQAKQKADLDSYLAIQTELKRVLDDGLVDEGTNAIESVASIAKKYVVERDKRIAVQLRQYVSQLEVLLKQSMLSDKIDEAKVAKEVLDKAKVELAKLEERLPKATPLIFGSSASKPPISKKDKTIQMLLGSWSVRNTKATSYSDIWTFKEDGFVVQGTGGVGEWTLDGNQVRIKWSDMAWDTFKLPLSKNVKGDSWAGNGTLRAVKQ